MRLLLLMLLSLLSAELFAQEVVLSGTPEKIIETDQFGNRATYSDFLKIDLRIVKDRDNYYWASRGNVPLAKISSGIYITYIAADGSGYVRTVNETARERFIEQTPDNLVGRYTYVEHISHDLTSSTIYGR